MAYHTLSNREGKSDETYIFFGYVNFLEMNQGVSVFGGTKSSNNHKEEVSYR